MRHDHHLWNDDGCSDCSFCTRIQNDDASACNANADHGVARWPLFFPCPFTLHFHTERWVSDAHPLRRIRALGCCGFIRSSLRSSISGDMVVAGVDSLRIAHGFTEKSHRPARLASPYALGVCAAERDSVDRLPVAGVFASGSAVIGDFGVWRVALPKLRAVILVCSAIVLANWMFRIVMMGGIQSYFLLHWYTRFGEAIEQWGTLFVLFQHATGALQIILTAATALLIDAVLKKHIRKYGILTKKYESILT